MSEREPSPNLLSSQDNKSIIHGLEHLKEKFRTIDSEASLFTLFTDLFFKRQTLDLVRICDLLRMIYEVEFLEPASLDLDKHLARFAIWITQDPGRYPRVVAEQVSLITSVREYLLAKSKAEAKIHRDVKAFGNSLKRSFAGIAGAEEIIAVAIARLEEERMNIDTTTSRIFIDEITKLLNSKKQLVIEFLEQEKADKRTAQLRAESRARRE